MLDRFPEYMVYLRYILAHTLVANPLTGCDSAFPSQYGTEFTMLTGIDVYHDAKLILGGE